MLHYAETLALTRNVTGRHRGKNCKLRAGYRAPVLFQL